eukprot:3935450-Rhodomonas_salina.1
MHAAEGSTRIWKESRSWLELSKPVLRGLLKVTSMTTLSVVVSTPARDTLVPRGSLDQREVAGLGRHGDSDLGVFAGPFSGLRKGDAIGLERRVVAGPDAQVVPRALGQGRQVQRCDALVHRGCDCWIRVRGLVQGVVIQDAPVVHTRPSAERQHPPWRCPGHIETERARDVDYQVGGCARSPDEDFAHNL